MNRKRSILLLAIFVMLLVVLTGCKLPVVPPTPKGVISGKVLMPSAAKELSRDITGWVPAMGATVTIEDANGRTRTTTTDANGKYNFENIKVNSNTIVTASITVNGKKMVLKAVIPQKVEANEVYDAGELTPESIALALVVEKLIDLKKDIDIKKIKDTEHFSDLVGEVEDLLEELGDITNDDDIAGLIDEVIDELYPEGDGGTAKVRAVSITTNPANVSGLANDVEVRVTLSTTTPGATIYYTLNGATPTSSSTKYTIPFTVKTSNPAGETITVKAIGIKSGLTNSVVSEKKITFRVKTYAVTFKDYDGAVLKEETVEHGQAATAPDSPTREGYTFSGWDSDFSNVTGNLIVTAQYTVNQYTITFNSNGGSAVASITQDYSTAVTPPDDPERDGYDFQGWVPAVPATMPVNGMNCVAQWTINSYTVTFQDYYETPIDIQTVEYGQAATAPANPTREGYTFSGWDSDFSNVTGNLIVTAQYTVNRYTITFDANGGTPTPDPITQDYGTAATPPDDPERGGYTFNGWVPAVPAAMPANNMACVAQWEEIEVFAISVKTQPTKLSYAAGQQLSLNRLVVTLIYNDASTEDVALANFGSKGITADPANGTTLSVATHNGKPVVLTCNSHTANTNNLTVAAKALNIVASSKSVTITSNYGDVVTETTIATITSGGSSTSWIDFGGKLLARVTTDFPDDMNSLVLTPNASSNIVSITGKKRSDRSVDSTDLTVVVCDKDDTSVTKSFTVRVSGSSGTTVLTIGTVAVP